VQNYVGFDEVSSFGVVDVLWKNLIFLETVEMRGNVVGLVLYKTIGHILKYKLIK
jgi:hypothetical protein